MDLEFKAKPISQATMKLELSKANHRFGIKLKANDRIGIKVKAKPTTDLELKAKPTIEIGFKKSQR
jgi:hypothetical protein